MGKTQSSSTNAFTLIGEVFAIAGALLKSRTDRGAEKLHSLSTATREYAATLTDMPQLRARVGAASESIDDVADYAIHTDIEHMVADATTFARKHPIASLSVAVAAGILVAAVLRSSAAAAPEIKTRKAPAKKKARVIARQRKGKKANSGQAHASQ